MNLIDLIDQFPDEKTCKIHLKNTREELGIRCKKCGNFDQKWLPKKEQWECIDCGFRTTLKSGTMFQNTKMPLRIWFLVMGYMTLTKKGFSAKELQRQVAHSRYEPIWFMMHKIRRFMATSNDRLNELFSKTSAGIIENISSDQSPNSKGKKQTAVDVLTYQKSIEKGGTIAILRLKTSTEKVKSSASSGLWPTMPIANMKRVIYGIHHTVQDKYLQNYLDEFSFKFCRRHYRNDAYFALHYWAFQPFGQTSGLTSQAEMTQLINAQIAAANAQTAS